MGEVFFDVTPEGDFAGGLAARVPLLAARLGHAGVSIARLGQDTFAQRLSAMLREGGVDTNSLQHDPDLPTARLIARTIGGRSTRMLDSLAAFDNLQWDFDLEDVAPQTDAVIFSDLARRHGQSRTTMDRFLLLCEHALRVYDLTTRAEDGMDRMMSLRAAELADGIVMDRAALRALTMGAEPDDVASWSLLRRVRAAFIVLLTDDCITAYSESGVASCAMNADSFDAASITVGIADGLLRALPWSACLDQAARLSGHVCRHKGDLAGVSPDVLAG